MDGRGGAGRRAILDDRLARLPEKLQAAVVQALEAAEAIAEETAGPPPHSTSGTRKMAKSMPKDGLSGPCKLGRPNSAARAPRGPPWGNDPLAEMGDIGRAAAKTAGAEK